MRRGRVHPLLILLLGLAVLPSAGGAQEIAGIAQDADGQPLPGVPIALHRVGGGGGASVAAATTDDEGRFQFFIEAADSAVYFVAMRHGGNMYIGPPARAGAESVTDYVLRASSENEAGAVAGALSGSAGPVPGQPRQGVPGPGPGGSDSNAVWFVAILAVIVGAIFVTTAPGYRRRRTREMVMELARVENRLAAAGPDAATARDVRRRETLRQRLGPRG